MEDITQQINHLKEIVEMLQLRMKTASVASQKVYSEAINDINESIRHLEEQVHSGREANESFWAQHQERLDKAWDSVLTYTLKRQGDMDISTTNEKPD